MEHTLIRSNGGILENLRCCGLEGVSPAPSESDESWILTWGRMMWISDSGATSLSDASKLSRAESKIDWTSESLSGKLSGGTGPLPVEPVVLVPVAEDSTRFRYLSCWRLTCLRVFCCWARALLPRSPPRRRPLYPPRPTPRDCTRVCIERFDVVCCACTWARIVFRVSCIDLGSAKRSGPKSPKSVCVSCVNVFLSCPSSTTGAR